jgi:uncharacterized protein (DUF2147 family)
MVRKYLLAAALFASPAFAASPIEGQWTNPARTVTVRIAPCGASLCGRVVSASPDAKAKAAAAGTPRLIGTELMSSLVPAGRGVWRGTFFVADRNVRAPGELRLLGPRALEIEGCAMGGLMCKTQQWTRVAPPRRARRR